VSTPLETELKLRLAPEQARRITGHPIVHHAARGGAARRHLVSVYYDTPDLNLRGRGMAVRLRKVAGRWVQTVKTDGRSRLGLHQRAEWEHPVSGPALEPDKVPDEEIRSLLAASPLQPAFVTDFWRTARLVEWSDGSQIELALDHGSIRAGQQVEPLCELELELKQGRPQSLYDMALAFAARARVSVENRSKAERGYALLGGGAGVAVRKAMPAGLNQDLPVEEAFAAIVCACLEHLEGNEQAVTVSRESEGVHQMRIALRRLRSAFSLFRSFIPRSASRAIEIEVKWLNRALGPARDWDVLTLETLDPLLRRVEPDEMTRGLECAVRKASEAAWRQALAAVQSARYTTLLLKTGQWLVGRRWREGMTGLQQRQLDTPVIAVAREVLEDRHRKLSRAGRHVASLTAEERHALRIRVKKLRYASDSLSELYPSSRAKRYGKALARLQNILGALNDGTVAGARMAEIGVAEGPAGRLVQGWHACQAQRWLAELPRAWDRFAEQKPFWR
jgi:triphosphatase